MISAIGMSLILQNYAQISQGPRQQGIPTLLSGVFRLEFDGGVVQITYTKVFILVASLLGMAILTYIIQRTRLGRICRATQQDRKMASILGINTDRVISLVFVIGAAMAGLAGVLITMNYGTFDFTSALSSASRPSPPRCWAASARCRARCWAGCCSAWRRRSSPAW